VSRLPAFKLATILGLVLAICAPAGLANAHSELISSDPPADSVVDTLPNSIVLTFSEKVLQLANANQVVVKDESGSEITAGDLQIEGGQVTAFLNGVTSHGEVSVGYRVVSADGHPIEGAFKFWVGEKKQTIAPGETGQDSGTNEDAWAWLALSIPALIFLFLTILKSKRKVNARTST
jgi:methionine-rich copper-binding protein CopC